MEHSSVQPIHPRSTIYVLSSMHLRAAISRGVKKFSYDIWGDTVNTASRMESSGEVGQVNISEATYELVKNVPGLTFTPRGKVQAKGKGEMEMYFVTRA
jgi:adenylate cyclase